MLLTIEPPKKLCTQLDLPLSKSISARLAVMDFLSKGNVFPESLADCDDTYMMVKALSQPDGVVDIQASGTAMRFLAALFAIKGFNVVLTGTERMKERPMAPLVEALQVLGGEISYMDKKGYPPLRIGKGSLHGGEIEMHGGISSQFVSALLMVAPLLPSALHLSLAGIVASRPYINMTMELMRAYGARVEWLSPSRIVVEPVPYGMVNVECERDWSAAAFWYQMVALSEDMEAKVFLDHLKLSESIQGDACVAEIFEGFGVKTHETEAGVLLAKSGNEDNASLFQRDMSDVPDLVQSVAVTCVMLGRPFHLSGVSTLRIKETDRIAALAAELGKLGAEIEAGADFVQWDGRKSSEVVIPVFDTYNDHRMAMAFAPCSLRLPRIGINNPEVVSKTYPQYWKHLEKAGFAMLGWKCS